jgi:tRNA(adenine34) deaminase
LSVAPATRNAPGPPRVRAALDTVEGRCYVEPAASPGHGTRRWATNGLNGRDRVWMEAALAEARAAGDEGEVPVGAVVVAGGAIVGRGRNAVERLLDPTAHAEILAIGAAARSLGAPRLTGATIYVTMEPCAMCAGAIVGARLARLVYGCRDPKAGYAGSLGNIVDDPALNHRVAVASGLLADECGALVSQFFERLRRGPPASRRSGEVG